MEKHTKKILFYSTKVLTTSALVIIFLAECKYVFMLSLSNNEKKKMTPPEISEVKRITIHIKENLVCFYF